MESDERRTGAHGEKVRLRAELLAARRARPAVDLERARADVCRHVLERLGGIETVAAYVAMRTEPGSAQLLIELAARCERVLVPITLDDRDLDWARWTADGIGEPVGTNAIGAAGLVLVPALAVARDGTRLGRGGGSFDRALPRSAPDAIIAALVFDDEVVGSLPSDPWDVRVGAAVTPRGWVALGGNAEVESSR